MNQEQHFQSSVVINSKHVESHIESTLIQMVEVLKVEKQVTTDGAIDLVRKFLGKKHNELIDDESKKTIDNVISKAEEKIKAGTITELERSLYKIIKYAGMA